MKKKLDKQKIKSLRQKQHAFSAINQVVAQPFAVFLMLVKCIQEVRAVVASICWFTAVRSFLRSTAVFTLQVIFSVLSYFRTRFLFFSDKRKISYNNIVKNCTTNKECTILI